jgi:hypothetical protein
VEHSYGLSAIDIAIVLIAGLGLKARKIEKFAIMAGQRRIGLFARTALTSRASHHQDRARGDAAHI